MVDLKKARRLLQKHWGYDDFRKDQRVVIDLALADNDVLVVLPTSAGKSACFQIPALMSDGGAIVVSPLIALMKDQVDDCVRRKIPATFINSHVDDEERDERLADFIAGAYKLLYVSPERFNSKSFLTEIARADVSYIVCDEAHCCSEYGHDFRPDYMRISRLVKALTKRGGHRPAILALTATATAKVVADIRTSLTMRDDYALVVADPIRANIKYVIEDVTGGGSSLRVASQLIDAMDLGGRHILYANTRKAAEKLVEIAEGSFGKSVAACYHAGMKKEEREKVQSAFKEGATPIVCATTAFGMGVDVPNIRTVVNVGLPGSIEAMVQQCGRAGRDGLPSIAVVIADDWSLQWQFSCIERENPPWQLYGGVWEWLHTQLTPESTLKQTLNSIAEAVAVAMRVQIGPEQAGGILRAMHSKGLIEARPIDAGTPLTIDAVKLEATVRSGKLQPPILRVATGLWNKVTAGSRELATADVNLRAVQLSVNKHALKDELRVSGYMLDKAFDHLIGHGVSHVGETYTGNQIRILQWRAELSEHLSQTSIEAKRELDLARFKAVVQFVRLPTEEDRNAFLRQYFLAPVEQP